MTMKKPDASLTPSPLSVQTMMPGIIQDPSISGLSFDQLIKGRGIRFLHRRAVPCPNMRTLDDNSHDPKCTYCDNSNFIHYGEREIVGIFQGNSLERLFEQQGMWEIGAAIVSFPAEYDDGTQADFNQFDQLFVPDFEVRLWELKEYERTDDKCQKLRYPVTSVDYMALIVNGQIRLFTQDVDFTITDGKIKWIVGHEPPYNSAIDRGAVLTIAYFAHPQYTVLQTMRELRVTQQYVNGQKIARRLPQEVMVRRDFLTRPGDKIE